MMKAKIILKEYLGIKNYVFDYCFKNITLADDCVEIEFYETEECERLDIITINKIPIKHIKELKTYDY